MSPTFHSDKLKKLISVYVKLITSLPLREAFISPVFDHEVVLAAWKEAFALVLAESSDEEVAILTHTGFKLGIGKLVEQRVAKVSWNIVLKHCKHHSVSEEMCSRCELERGIARQALIEDANITPQDALGRDNGDSINATFWGLMAEKGACENKCHEREYVACLCPFDNTLAGKTQRILLAWSKKNTALDVDISYRNHYLDFMMRHVEYENCVVCRETKHNIELPRNKRICLCEQSERSRCIFNTLDVDLSNEIAELDIATTYAMIRAMVANFEFKVVKDGEVVVQN